MGWSSSRWLSGTQFGWCHAVGLAVPQAGERSVVVTGSAKPTTYNHASRGLVGLLSNQNVKLKKQVKIINPNPKTV